MPINKSDIIQTRGGKTYTYVYSHHEEIVINDKIWLRHIWNLVTPENHWRPSENTRLMDYEPTDRPATFRDYMKGDKP